MSDFVKPVVGQRYNLGGEVVEVAEAAKKRYWRIVVNPVDEDGEALIVTRTVPQAEWAAKASHVGPQE